MSEEPEKFTWLDTYKQIVDFLATHKQKQSVLIEVLKEVGVTGFNDRDASGNVFEISEIDPFTFFSYINKYGTPKRIQILQRLATKLGVSTTPTDDSGIPSSNAQKVWMFPYQYDRVNNEIDRLWNIFFGVIEARLDDELFEDTLQIRGTGKAKLTEALFCINSSLKICCFKAELKK